MRSKYLVVYETLCPDDPISSDDPRRVNIIREMKRVEKAATNREAADIIEWWEWDSDGQLMAFVKKARNLLSQSNSKS